MQHEALAPALVLVLTGLRSRASLEHYVCVCARARAPRWYCMIVAWDFGDSYVGWTVSFAFMFTGCSSLVLGVQACGVFMCGRTPC